MTIWITSDPHYGHKNIVRGETTWDIASNNMVRNFNTLEEMNNTIVENINSCVKENDQLICLGDWNFGGIANLPIFRDSLICKDISLICGNHDNRHGQVWNPPVNGKNAADYFSSYDMYKEMFYKGKHLVLFHFPINSWNNMKESIHFFGHCHSSESTKFFNGGRSMDVGLDGNNMMPYKLDDAIDILATKSPKTEGHH